MSRRKTILPKVAQRFLQTPEGYTARRIVNLFHRWMDLRCLNSFLLKPTHIEEFIDRPFRLKLGLPGRRAYKYRVIRYLMWLHEQSHICFDPDVLWYHPKRLPQVAKDFLASLEPTLKASTLNIYATNLRKFHSWVARKQINLRLIKRRDTEAWLQELSASRLHPSTRWHTILNTRTYLRWLWENGSIRADPDDLIRSRDLPKLPSYLPRPLPPSVDVELQKRLLASDRLEHWGLALMRRTGLRIGELMGLEYDCVRWEHQNAFLKVPLGKMNSERLVPIDERTAELVKKLRACRPQPRTWLLESSFGERTKYPDYAIALRDACRGLEIPGAMTSHRLRHTYATSLLNAGMSLVGLMRLLGHRDFRMTLRYAAISQETVGQEYFRALKQVETRYPALRSPQVETHDPIRLLRDAKRWIANNYAPGSDHHRVGKSLTKRIDRITSDLERLKSHSSDRPR